MNQNDGENKRKHSYKTPKPAKKFQTNNIRYRDGGAHYDRYYRSEMPFSNSYKASGHSWRSGNKNLNRANGYRSPYFHHTHYRDFSSELPPEPEGPQLVGPGSDTERVEKVMATKRRIEEALAAKAGAEESSSQDIDFHNSAKEILKEKSVDKSLPNTIASLELPLTSNDFREIGSVGSGAAVDGDEGSDLVLNVAPSSTQQRSFNSAVPSNSNPKASSTSENQRPKASGWNVSELNEITSDPSSSTQHISSYPKGGGEMYFQGSVERILGNIELPAEKQSVESNPAPTCSPRQDNSNKNKFAEVGRLYQSFLKSRYRGCTLKVKKNQQAKSAVPNPYFDQAVLDNQSSAGNQAPSQSENVLELQMPRPIVQLKAEVSNNVGAVQSNSTEDIEAKEASKFCEEYSFLLTHPNFLIPPEDLVKLGLGHLSEMNKLIDERRSNVYEPESVPPSLRIRSVSALNDVRESDILFNRTPDSTVPSFHFQDPIYSNGTNPILGLRTNNTNLNGLDTVEFPSSAHQHQSSTFPFLQENQPTHMDASSPQSARRQTPNSTNPVLNVPNTQTPSDVNISVESMVEKVVEKLIQSPFINAQRPNLDSVLRPNVTSTPQSLTACNTEPSSSQIQSISNKILRLFLIDKQIEELITEKMKLYTELLSAKEISSTLFNSWAQDQIQQGNVMNVVSNTSRSIPELNRILKKEMQLPMSEEVQFCNTTIHDALSFLKTEGSEAATGSAMLQVSKVEVVEPPITRSLGANDESVDSNRPKLSVRKDLLDPNVNRMLNLDYANSNTPQDEPDKLDIGTNEPDKLDIGSNEPQNKTEPEDNTQKKKKKSTKSLQENSKEKKKKTKKKEERAVEFINLVDDSTDDEEISPMNNGMIGNEVVNEPGSINVQGVSTEYKKTPKPKRMNISFTIQNTATCITVLKRALIVGCKEGSIVVFSLISGEMHFKRKVHQDPIVSLHVLYYKTPQKYVLTGSTDSTIKVFSLELQSELQTIQADSPVQSCDITFNKAYFGTKTGYLLSYKIKMSKSESGDFPVLEQAQPPLQLTNSSILAVKAAKEGARSVIIVASRGEQISVRDATSGLLLRSFDWCDTVHCLQLYGRTPFVYCGTNTRSIKVVNFTNGENTNNECIGLARSVIQIIFQQSVLFAACYDGKVYVYDVEDKKLITFVEVSEGLIVSIAICKQKIIIANNRDKIQLIVFPAELKAHLKRKIITPKSATQLQS